MENEVEGGQDADHGMIKTTALQQLKKIVPTGEISVEPSVLEQNAGDKWFAAHKPDAVALPRSTKSVSAILQFANKHRIPVTPRGAGHGYVGGAVPITQAVTRLLVDPIPLQAPAPAPSR